MSASQGSKGGLGTFLVLWAGQAVCSLGNQLTGFALAVWTYQQTGSVTDLALITFFTTAPNVFLSPIAGALVDRWDRRWAMVVSDAGAGLATLVLVALFFSGRLEVWQIYLAMAVSSAFQSLRWPAMTASVTLLVAKRHYGRASGLTQLGVAGAQVLAPVLAASLIGVIQVGGVMAVDCATFLAAILTLLLIRVPRPRPSEEGSRRSSLWREAGFGWTYIVQRPGLLGLLLMFTAANFAVSMVVVLIYPLVLSFTSEQVLGVVLSVASAGLVAGGILMVVWGGPRRRMTGILVPMAAQGAMLFVAAARESPVLIAAGAFLFLFGLPVVNGCSQALWQSKVAPDVQGRVFAMRRMVALASAPLGSLVAGPLADRVFEPLLTDGGPLAATVGRLVGTGEGRGIAFFLVLLGLLLLLTVAVAAARPRLRRLEEELPDAVDHDEVAGGPEEPGAVAGAAGAPATPPTASPAPGESGDAA